MLDFAVYVRYMPSRRLRRLDKPLVILILYTYIFFLCQQGKHQVLPAPPFL